MRARKINANQDLEMILISNEISAARFIDGGALMFAETAIKNHIDIDGARVKRPAVNIRLRVLEDSYIELAREKSHEETRPWATIIIRLPVKLHLENRRSLASMRPIWLTDA